LDINNQPLSLETQGEVLVGIRSQQDQDLNPHPVESPDQATFSQSQIPLEHDSDNEQALDPLDLIEETSSNDDYEEDDFFTDYQTAEEGTDYFTDEEFNSTIDYEGWEMSASKEFDAIPHLSANGGNYHIWQMHVELACKTCKGIYMTEYSTPSRNNSPTLYLSNMPRRTHSAYAILEGLKTDFGTSITATEAWTEE
ncbi:hypothetical protein AX16_009095, partial [Volvariella volvacea WC 439]